MAYVGWQIDHWGFGPRKPFMFLTLEIYWTRASAIGSDGLKGLLAPQTHRPGSGPLS